MFSSTDSEFLFLLIFFLIGKKKKKKHVAFTLQITVLNRKGLKPEQCVNCSVVLIGRHNGEKLTLETGLRLVYTTHRCAGSVFLLSQEREQPVPVCLSCVCVCMHACFA